MAAVKDVPLLSEVEQLILLAVMKIETQGHAYAVPIRRLIRDEAGVTLPNGSVYVTLDRLERKGLIRSWLSDPVEARGGKARRLFGLRTPGMIALRATTRAMHRMMAGTVFAKG